MTVCTPLSFQTIFELDSVLSPNGHQEPTKHFDLTEGHFPHMRQQKRNFFRTSILFHHLVFRFCFGFQKLFKDACSCFFAYQLLGTHLCGIGSVGSGDNQMKYPAGVNFGMNGTLLVADTSNHRIQVWAPS